VFRSSGPPSGIKIHDFHICTCILKLRILIPDDGPKDGNTWHSLTKLIKFVVVDGNTYVNIGNHYKVHKPEEDRHPNKNSHREKLKRTET
jgi:hypothetical protein